MSTLAVPSAATATPTTQPVPSAWLLRLPYPLRNALRRWRTLTEVRSWPEVQSALGTLSWTMTREPETARRRGQPTEVLSVIGVSGDPTLVPGMLTLDDGRWLRNPADVVADMRTLQAETTDVDEFLVTQVRVGQQVQVTVDTLDNLSLQGTVKSVAGLPQTDSTGGQSYPVIITVNSTPSTLKAGMSIRVTFPEQIP